MAGFWIPTVQILPVWIFPIRPASSITENRRSEQVKRRLQEWERKFGPFEDVPRRRHIGGPVGPTIRPDATDVMTDDQWLAAIAKHSGPFGMTQELQRVARNNPSRFGRLIERIPKAAQPAYLEAFIMAMADESVPAETAFAACRIGHQLEGRALWESSPDCIDE